MAFRRGGRGLAFRRGGRARDLRGGRGAPGKVPGRWASRPDPARKLPVVSALSARLAAMSSGNAGSGGREGAPRAAAALCGLYHEAGQRLRRLQDQLAARDVLIARLRARLAALEGDTAPSLVDALLEQVARFREQLRQRDGGAAEAALRQVRAERAQAAERPHGGRARHASSARGPRAGRVPGVCAPVGREGCVVWLGLSGLCLGGSGRVRAALGVSVSCRVLRVCVWVVFRGVCSRVGSEGCLPV